MAVVASSPASSLAGAKIRVQVTDTVTNLECAEPDVFVTSVPADSRIRPGSRLSTYGAPSGEVLYDAANTVERFSSSLAEADGYWAGATLTFTSGRLTGVSRVIGLDEESSLLPMLEPLPLVPEVGDTFELTIADDDERARLILTPDVPGEYVLTGHSVAEFVTPPTFGGDSAGHAMRIVGAAQTLTVHVAEPLDLPIVPENGHGITLRLKVANETIVSAQLIRPLTSTALAASIDPGVLTALNAMVGETASTVGNALQATANNLRAKYEAHRVKTSAATHAAADATNPALADDAHDDESAIRLINRLRAVIYAHLTGASAAGARWHTEDDTKNIPAIAPARTRAEATVLLADLAYRVYPGHLAQIASPGSHGSADATNTITVTKSDLSEFVRVYLNFVTQTNPTIPAGLPEGAIDMRTRYGFRTAT